MKRMQGIGVLVLSAIVLVSVFSGCQPTGTNAVKPHFYELESAYSNGIGEAVKLIEDDGFQYNPAYTYNSPNSTQVNSTGKETGSGWVGNPSDNPINETCFIQFFDSAGNNLDSTALGALSETPRVRIAWHDCTVDNAQSVASQLQTTCGLGNLIGEGWLLDLKDGIWSSFGTATLNGVDGEWEIRIVGGKLIEGSSPMVMVEWNPYTSDYTEAKAREGAQ